MIKSTGRKVSRFSPIIGILAYVVLYFVAVKLYPGGSSLYPDSIGFDWGKNYWCHLISDYSFNGEPNLAQPYAYIRMIILGISMGIFFYQFHLYFKLNPPWKLIVPIWNIWIIYVYAYYVWLS